MVAVPDEVTAFGRRVAAGLRSELGDDPSRTALQHVYWLGGGSGAGKSTVARRLADRHGCVVVGTDDLMADHGARMTAEDSPLAKAFAAMDADERWVNRSPEEMLETFHWFVGEGFGLIVEDLLALPTQRPVVVEGFRLLPQLVRPLLPSPSHAAWLLPTPAFREAAFERRRPSGAPWSFVDRTSDPVRALHNLLERDRLFTDRLAAAATDLGLRAIEVDRATGADDILDRVDRWFGL